MRVLPLIGLLTLAACSSTSGFQIRDASCDIDVADYDRNLTAHLVAGAGDGTFAYEPDGASIAWIEGSYDLSTGDFSWTEEGAEESWVATIEVRDAYGYANTNGDLDVVGTRVVTDVLDVSEETQFRIERTGCEQEVRVRSWSEGVVERERIEEGTFTADGYTYVQTTDIDGSAYVAEGSRQADGAYSEVLTYATDTYEYEGSRTGNIADGTSLTEYEEVYQTQGGQVIREGSRELLVDGSRIESFSQTSSQGTSQWDYTVDYEGNGEGRVVGPGYDCALEFIDNRCTFDCGGGQTGNC